MKKAKPLKKLKQTCWEWFSKYIRLKYSDNGWCTCITCNEVMYWKEAQAGHGIPGRTNSILFLEEIVRPQCARCNVFKGGVLEVYVPYLIDTYGRDGYEELLRMKGQSRKFTRIELEEMTLEFKSEAQRLMAKYGG